VDCAFLTGPAGGGIGGPDPPDPPPDVVPTDPNGQVIRSGWCESINGSRLPWATYRKGCRYRFEECSAEKGRAYYRVYAGDAYGVVGVGRFADLLAEEPAP
jgi:hypothetical protein